MWLSFLFSKPEAAPDQLGELKTALIQTLTLLIKQEEGTLYNLTACYGVDCELTLALLHQSQKEIEDRFSKAFQRSSQEFFRSKSVFLSLAEKLDSAADQGMTIEQEDELILSFCQTLREALCDTFLSIYTQSLEFLKAEIVATGSLSQANSIVSIFVTSLKKGVDSAISKEVQKITGTPPSDQDLPLVA